MILSIVLPSMQCKFLNSATYFTFFTGYIRLPHFIMLPQSKILIFVACFLVACATANRMVLDSRAVLRQHHGVMFTPETSFRPVVGYWLHTFGFSLPIHPCYNISRELNCSVVRTDNDTHCLHVTQFIDSLDQIQTVMSHNHVTGYYT